MPFNVNEKSSTNLVSISKFLKGRVSPFFNTFIGVNIWHSGLGVAHPGWVAPCTGYIVEEGKVKI